MWFSNFQWASFEYNVKVTKEVVARAHAVGASVEGELGVIGSLETGKGDKSKGVRGLKPYTISNGENLVAECIARL